MANLQAYINKILAKKLDVFMIIYLNNILIYTNKIDLQIDFILYNYN